MTKGYRDRAINPSPLDFVNRSGMSGVTMTPLNVTRFGRAQAAAGDNYDKSMLSHSHLNVTRDIQALQNQIRPAHDKSYMMRY